MRNKIVDARPVTTPARAPKQRSFALAADKPPLFRLSRAGIDRFTVRTATSQSRADEVVAPEAEEIATGIAAATDLLFACRATGCSGADSRFAVSFSASPSGFWFCQNGLTSDDCAKCNSHALACSPDSSSGRPSCGDGMRES